MVVEVIAPRLLGPALMVAAAIIVQGYTDVGDGFSAGAIIALAIGLRYIALGYEEAERTLPILRRAPAATAGGLLIALAAGFFPVLLGEPPFSHQPAPGEEVVKIGTLELTTAVAFDFGLCILVASGLVIVFHQLARLVQEEEPS